MAKFTAKNWLHLRWDPKQYFGDSRGYALDRTVKLAALIFILNGSLRGTSISVKCFCASVNGMILQNNRYSFCLRWHFIPLKQFFLAFNLITLKSLVFSLFFS